MSDLKKTSTATTRRETPGGRVQSTDTSQRTQTQSGTSTQETKEDEGAVITFEVPILGGLCDEDAPPI